VLPVHPDELADQGAIVDAEVEFPRKSGRGPDPGQLANIDKPVEVGDSGDFLTAASPALVAADRLRPIHAPEEGWRTLGNPGSVIRARRCR
jgi:hypothetical protein